MEPLSGEDEWRRMEREHPVMRMTRNDKGECSYVTVVVGYQFIYGSFFGGG